MTDVSKSVFISGKVKGQGPLAREWSPRASLIESGQSRHCFSLVTVKLYVCLSGGGSQHVNTLLMKLAGRWFTASSNYRFLSHCIRFCLLTDWKVLLD